MNGRSYKGDNVDPRFVLDPFEPSYITLSEEGKLEDLVLIALQELNDCCACPRNCHVDRMAGQTSVCKTGRYARVASASPHFGEEDCLTGRNGSGTIFFACCNLHCEFCQNWDISQQAVGTECAADRIAELMIALQERGCHNTFKTTV